MNLQQKISKKTTAFFLFALIFSACSIQAQSDSSAADRNLKNETAVLKSSSDLLLGRSPYALMSNNFNYAAYKKGMEGIPEYVVVTLWNTFGTSTVNYTAELADTRVKGTELVLLNETCVSNRNCGSYEVLAGHNSKSLGQAISQRDPILKAKVLSSAQSAAGFLSANLKPNQFCLINPLLETRQTRANWQTLVDWIKPVFDARCQFIWNPVGGRPGIAQVPALFAEGHGAAPVFTDTNCVANPDGTVISDSAYLPYLLKYAASCRYACTWGLNDNCNYPGSPSVDPRQRSCKAIDDFARFNTVMKQVLDSQ